MSGISATEAAFEGFRVARERPKIIAVWTLAWFAMSIVIGVVSVKLGGSAFRDLIVFLENPPAQPDIARMTRLYAELGPMMATLVPLSLVFYAVLMTSAYRLVIDPARIGLGLKIGMEEVRQLALIILLGGCIVLAYTAAFIAVGVLVAGIAAVSPVLGGLLAAVGLVAVVGLVLYLAVRLSLAGPQTLDAGRLRLFETWRLTKGRVWPIFGAYALATVFAIIVSLLGGLVVAGVFAVLAGGATKLLDPDTTSLASYFTPIYTAYLACSAILSSLTWAILMCPAAVIYRQLGARAESAG